MMKRNIRLACLLMAVILLAGLLTGFSFAETPPTDEDLIAQYNIPNSWARPALLFAVRNGLLFGTENGLEPKKEITRAEVAAILVRLLGITSSADLSAFADVKPNAWYAAPLSGALAAGLIHGDGKGSLHPTENITRQEAFLMISQMIGLSGGSRAELNDFNDAGSVSSWAKNSMTAMVHAGFVRGSANCLNPKKSITRQEFVQVLYTVFTGIGTEISSKYTGSFVLISGSVPAKTSVSGDLLLSSEASEITLENITVSGRLVIQGCGDLTLDLNNCRIGTLVLCRNCTVRITGGTVNRITVFSPSSIQGSCSSLDIHADTVFGGSAHSAAVVSGALNASDGSIDKKYSAEEYRKAQDVKLVRIPGKTTKKVNLYESSNANGDSKVICSLAANTPFTLIDHDGLYYHVKLSDGTVGYIAPGNVSIPSSNFYVNDDYTQNVKECYVNYIYSFESRTDYLIWVNRWTLKFCVFRRNSGQWDLIRSVPCAIGKNDTPTQEGIFCIYGKTDVFDAGDHYYHHVTWFWPNAIHSRLYNNDGSFYDASMSKTVSDGCVRLYDEDAIWVYDNIPIPTAVIVH